MARLRKGVSYRNLERPYTRVSKYRKESYVKANPAKHIVRFEMGNTTDDFEYIIKLISKDGVQIRDNALESARQTANKILEERAGLQNYHLKLKTYPYHLLRENPLAAGAGADRMSTGMKHSFGKVIGRAAQIKKGKTVMQVRVNKEHVALGKKAMKRAQHKIPCSCTIDISQK